LRRRGQNSRLFFIINIFIIFAGMIKKQKKDFNKPLNILMLSYKDFAGSGRKLLNAVEKVSNFKTRLILAEQSNNDTCYDYLIDKVNKEWLQEKIINKADIIHFKGDDLPQSNWHGFEIPNHIPIIITAGGSGFRRHCKDKSYSAAWFNLQQYINKSDFRTTLTPDLNYNEYKGEYIPECIDSTTEPFTFQLRDIPLIVASPTNRVRKGIDKYLIPAIEILNKKGIKCELLLIENKSYDECLNLKKGATLFFDQMNEVGFYGNSAIEAMQYGIPVINYISDSAIEQSNGRLTREYLPVQSMKELTVESLVKCIEKTLKMDLIKLAKRTKKFCDEFHSYENIGNIWCNKYKELYLQPKFEQKRFFKEELKFTQTEINVNKFETKQLNSEIMSILKVFIINEKDSEGNKIGSKGEILHLEQSTANVLINKGLVALFNEDKYQQVIKDAEQKFIASELNTKVKENKETFETKELKTNIETKEVKTNKSKGRPKIKK
jgi:hypothetical protein